MMRTSETTGALAKALAQAQATMTNAPLNKTNPHYKSRYADLSAVREATVPALAKHGLAITQVPGFSADHGLVLYTRLSHAEGEWIQAEYPLVVGNPQQMGSALTYARRYCWAAICGIAADEDDDANEAGEAQPQSARKPSQPRGVKESPSGQALRADSGHEGAAAGGHAPTLRELAVRARNAILGAPNVDALDKLWERILRRDDLEPALGRLNEEYEKARAKFTGPTPREIPGVTYDPLDDTENAVADLEESK